MDLNPPYRVNAPITRHSIPAMIRMMLRDSPWRATMIIPMISRKMPDMRESFQGLNFSMVTSIGYHREGVSGTHT